MKKWSLDYIKQLPSQEKRLTFSTILTIARFILIPIIVYAMVIQQWGVAFWLFLVAAVTDVLDGYSARMRNEQTFLGACLDPIADKFLLLSCFLALAFIPTPLFSVPWWFVAIVLIKEFVLLFGAVLLVCVFQQSIIMPTLLGKATTAIQMLFIIWLFACYFFHWMPIKTYWVMLGLLLAMTIATFCDYAVRAICIHLKVKV